VKVGSAHTEARTAPGTGTGTGASTGARGDWARYWRAERQPIEAMHAHFSSHVYHRHSHDSYSFGMTETGAQAFTCRGGRHVSAVGMVMLFNPDDPHDGQCATGQGFTYRMIHIDPGLVTDLLADVRGRPSGLPLFPEPVAEDAGLAASLSDLHAVLTGTATPLEQHEQLTGTVARLTRHAAFRDRAAGPAGLVTSSSAALPAARMRNLLHDGYASPLTADDLAEAAGCSRYAAYRAFSATFGLAPSDYQRQLRLRAARRLLGTGMPAAQAATEAGFADQAHLTRWFRRVYGVTPGAYVQAAR
jgi:AraC-like DNA-binding protein